MKIKQLQKKEIHENKINLAELTKNRKTTLKISFINFNKDLYKKLTEIVYNDAVYITNSYNQNRTHFLIKEKKHKLFFPKSKIFEIRVCYYPEIIKNRKDKFIDLENVQNNIRRRLNFQKILTSNLKKLCWKFYEILRRYKK